jgi:hypothetical protein
VIEKTCSSDEISAQVTRIWSLIPQPRKVESASSVCRARLTAVDATLPSCDLFDGANVLFGRSDKCHVRIADATVSHEHCRVYVQDNEIYLEDL